MKQTVLSLAAVMFAASAFAQGTVNFSTRIPGTVDAPVTYGGAKVGADFWGQLFAGPPGTTALTAVGVPVAFRADAGIGYITGGGPITIPGIAGGSPAQVALYAWKATQGATYAAALAAGQGGIGNSSVITVNTGGGGVPPSPASNLAGLTGFEVTTVVPEPSIAAFGLLGVGLLLIRRKK